MAEKVDLAELERYLRIYQENPDSRVFAPLADIYRRLGRLDESLEIVNDGLRRHPYYAGGRVALAHVLLDMGKIPSAIQEAESVVLYYPDNLLARKILIRALAQGGRSEDARREWEILKGLAPEVAADPLLERALASRSKAPPQIRPKLLKEKEITPSVQRSQKQALEKQRVYLETWIRLLGST